MSPVYRIKYINFNLVLFFVRDLHGGETYSLNNPRIAIFTRIISFLLQLKSEKKIKNQGATRGFEPRTFRSEVGSSLIKNVKKSYYPYFLITP